MKKIYTEQLLISFFLLIVVVEHMEVMDIPRERYVAVTHKAKAFFSDMESHQSKWLNICHLKGSKSSLKGM